MPGTTDNADAIDRGDDFTPEIEGQAAKPADAAVDKTGKEPTLDELGDKGGDKGGAKDDKGGQDDDKGGEDKGSGRKDSRIPLARHEAVLAREREQRKALETRLQQYERGAQVANTNETITKMEDNILSLEKQYTKLITDGEIDKATDVMTQIRRTERLLSQQQNALEIQAAEARAAERVRYDVALDRLEQAYPVLNPDHDDYDADKLAEVVELKTAYEKNGRTPTDAMQRAVKLILGAEGSRQASATSVKPKVDVDEVAAAAAKEVAAERKQAAVDKGLEAKGKQPPDLNGLGKDSDKAGASRTAADVMKMSQKDFAALSEDELAKLRGDFVE